MDYISNLKLGNLCRICLNKETTESLIFIFDNENIEKMLKVFCEVTNIPEAPQHICSNCCTNLKIAYEFRELCFKSNKILKNKEDSLYLNKSTQTIDFLDFPCEKCEEKFRTINDLKVHRNEEHKNELHICRFCDKRFSRLGRLREHLNIAHTEFGYVSSFVCQICSKNFGRKDHLLRHFKYIHHCDSSIDDNGSKVDQNMERSIEDELNPTSNIKIESEEIKSDCEESDSEIILDFFEEKPVISNPNEELLSKKLLSKNHKDPISGKPQCQICLKTFSRPYHLHRHELIHSKSRSFECQVQGCGKKFTRNEHLKKHLKVCQKNKKKLKTFLCNFCDKAFASKEILSRHIDLHNKAEFNCKYCTLILTNQDEIKQHMKEFHSSEEIQFLCNLCGMGFTRNDYLKNHLRRHTGEKPFKCKFCGKGFPRTSDLNVHEKYHTDEKNHVCDTCGKKFTRSYNLVIHRRVHTGERPFLCPHCPKTFTQSNDMKAHIRRHTGERFWCEICNEGFLQMYRLTQHKKISHGIEVPSNIKRLEKFVLLDNEDNV